MHSLTGKGDKTGKIRWIDLEPLTAMMILGMLVVLIGPRNALRVFLLLPFILAILGLLLLVISKVSLFPQGVWFSFGPQLMTRGYARLYRLSYILIGVGVLLLLFLAWTLPQ